jgi:hypothetical protein
MVSDRHDRGDLSLALRITELVWDVADQIDVTGLKGELCTIASEVFSHHGLPDSNPDASKWRERAAALSNIAWADNLVAARAARLDHRCQTVQLGSFNLFDFENAYCEFSDHIEGYETSVGGAEVLAVETDELYGKLLGTLGQAAGFLRPQDMETGSEAWRWLTRSTPHFVKSQPLFRSMNLGFRLTDLWDRGELDDAITLMNAEGLPQANESDPFSLLHRLWIAAARSQAGLKREPSKPLVRRLLKLLENRPTSGATPFDLCLKWAIFLDPVRQTLREAADQWVAEFDSNRVAIMATSLPLLVQLGRFDQAREHLALLDLWPGFVAHWRSERAESLARCLTDGTSPDFQALKGMPWNYA